MKSIFDLANNNGETFGPGTDLVISLVAVLVLLLALHSVKSKKQDMILQSIKASQMAIINEIAHKYNVTPLPKGNHQFNIPITLDSGLKDTIRIENDATLQRISFGNTILFDNNKTTIKRRGKKVLTNICSVFKKKLNLIKEIQVQGHASADSKSVKGIREDSDNLVLAGERAISIVRFFRDDKTLKLDPAKHVVYASSFGYYMPVERNYLENNWNLNRIAKVNQLDNGDKNKRIEIVLNYKEGKK